MIKSMKNGEMIVLVPSTEHAYMLMNIAEHLNCIIQKYYWVSKFDTEYIEYIEPKIYDAFNCEIVLKGNNDDLGGVYEVYQTKKELLNNLPKEPKMTEVEIKELAEQMLNEITKEALASL